MTIPGSERSSALLLQERLDQARIAARIEPSDDGSALHLVLLGGSRLPFRHFPAAQAEAWLKDARIEASTGTDKEDNVVISGSTEAIGDLTDRLTQNPILAEEAAAALLSALENCGLDRAEVMTSAEEAVAIRIPNTDGFDTAVKLGVLLGADTIAQGLDLDTLKGVQDLADRLHPVLTGAAGPDVAVAVEARHNRLRPGDCLIVLLGGDEATRLIERITAATSPSS